MESSETRYATCRFFICVGVDVGGKEILKDDDLSDEDIPDRLSQSLRSIRGSAKRKRMEKMLSTDLSQSFDGRRLFSEPTSPAVGLGSRTNTYQGDFQFFNANNSLQKFRSSLERY